MPPKPRSRRSPVRPALPKGNVSRPSESVAPAGAAAAAASATIPGASTRQPSVQPRNAVSEGSSSNRRSQTRQETPLFGLSLSRQPSPLQSRFGHDSDSEDHSRSSRGQSSDRSASRREEQLQKQLDESRANEARTQGQLENMTTVSYFYSYKGTHSQH